MSKASDLRCTLAVLGAGPGGYSAAFRAADLGIDTVLIEREPVLGGVCLNAGCIPSKALLHTAAVIEEAAALTAHGVAFGKPAVSVEALRAHKDKVIGKLTGGLAAMAKARKVRIVRGVGGFRDSKSFDVQLEAGGAQTVTFETAIIAAGSEAIRLPFLPADPRIVDSTGALELRDIPKHMLVIGGGIIGLEMATIYAALGSRCDIVEVLGGLMPGADRDLVKVWSRRNASRFGRIMLRTKAVAAEARKDGVHIRFEGEGAPREAIAYDLVLVAVGRTPSGRLIGAGRAGVQVSERGYIETDRQMRTSVPHIFAIGDIAGAPMLAHKAVHEGHVAAEVVAGKPSSFDARQIPSVAYTDPEIAWAGRTEDELTAEGRPFGKAVFPWSASGRAIASGREDGVTKLLFDSETDRIIGGGIAGVHAGDLIGEICLAIEMGADAVDIARTIHPHPTFSETIGLAGEVHEGTCTDLPPRASR